MKRTDRLKTTAIAAAFTFVGTYIVYAAAVDAIGTWRDTETGGILSVYTCTGGVCVKIVMPSKGREIDSNNSDSTLKGRPMAGVVIMNGAANEGADRWKGNLYNSEDGKTYSGYLIVDNKDELKLEGCILAGLVCKSHIWKRAQ